MMVWLFEPKRPRRSRPQHECRPGHAFPWGAALIRRRHLFFSMLYYVFIINGALVFKEVGVTSPSAMAR